jgi:hypothetical protein
MTAKMLEPTCSTFRIRRVCQILMCAFVCLCRSVRTTGCVTGLWARVGASAASGETHASDVRLHLARTCHLCPHLMLHHHCAPVSHAYSHMSLHVCVCQSCVRMSAVATAVVWAWTSLCHVLPYLIYPYVCCCACVCQSCVRTSAVATAVVWVWTSWRSPRTPCPSATTTQDTAPSTTGYAFGKDRHYLRWMQHGSESNRHVRGEGPILGFCLSCSNDVMEPHSSVERCHETTFLCATMS